MNVVCTICARGGSKGVKNKNIRLINGRPLIAHSIDQARRSGLFKTIAVSSDSSEILTVAKDHGANVLIEREPQLATDSAAKLPVIQDCFLQAEKASRLTFDFGIDLDCTSPLRTPEDIVQAFEMYRSQPGAHNLITGAPARRSPYFNLVKKTAENYVQLASDSKLKIERRQDAPVCYDMNASIYIWRRDSLLENVPVINERTILFEMPEERSLDIDSELDFQIVDFLMSRPKEKNL